MSDTKDNVYGIAIDDIKLVQFNHQQEANSYNKEDLRIEFSTSINIEDDKFIVVTPEVTYKIASEKIIANITVQNKFQVQDLKKLMSGNVYNIPSDLLIELYEISLHHLRGILAVRSSYPDSSHLLLPLITNNTVRKIVAGL